MRTRILRVDRDHPDPMILAEAARVINAGGLVAFPTETVYGLAADATSATAVQRIFEAKGRPSNNPLIVHAHNLSMAKGCVSDWPQDAETLAAAFWPGPLTVVLPKASWVPDCVTSGRLSVGIRIPAPEISRRLIEAAGCPLAAPSANRSTGISPTLASHVLKDLDGRVELIIDAGPASVGLESTVLDLTGAVPRVLRPGSISPESISECLNGRQISVGPEQNAPGASFASPGQMLVHYSPRTPTWWVEDLHESVGEPAKSAAIVLGYRGIPPGLLPSRRLIRLETPEEAASQLYSSMHQLDDEGWDAILLFAPPATPEWRAIRDRIERAGRPSG